MHTTSDRNENSNYDLNVTTTNSSNSDVKPLTLPKPLATPKPPAKYWDIVQSINCIVKSISKDAVVKDQTVIINGKKFKCKFVLDFDRSKLKRLVSMLIDYSMVTGKPVILVKKWKGLMIVELESKEDLKHLKQWLASLSKRSTKCYHVIVNGVKVDEKLIY